MKGQVVLITGSSSGIGRETAYRFAQTGAKIILSYYKGKARGEKAEKLCRKLGAESTLLLHLDVTDDKSIKDAAKRVLRAYVRGYRKGRKAQQALLCKSFKKAQ